METTDCQDDTAALLNNESDNFVRVAPTILPRIPPTGDDSDNDEIGDAVEYVTLSSYGGDYDFYGTSDGAVPYGAHPIFTRRVVFFFITTFLIRPACCAAFLAYGKVTGDQSFLVLGMVVTISFYATLSLHGYLIRRNVALDRMPLSKTQVVLLGLLEISGPLAFVVMTYVKTFDEHILFGHLLMATASQDDGVSAAERTALVTCITMVANLIYAIISVSDATGFIIPRLWVKAVMKTYVPF